MDPEARSQRLLRLTGNDLDEAIRARRKGRKPKSAD